jgi:hypothetical protein
MQMNLFLYPTPLENTSRATIYYCLALKLQTTEEKIKIRIMEYMKENENNIIFRNTIYAVSDIVSSSVDSIRSSLFQMFISEIEVGECRLETLCFLMKHINNIFNEIDIIVLEYSKNNLLPVPENSFITVRYGNEDLSTYDFYDFKSTAILYFADRSSQIKYRLLSAMPITLDNSS